MLEDVNVNKVMEEVKNAEDVVVPMDASKGVVMLVVGGVVVITAAAGFAVKKWVIPAWKNHKAKKTAKEEQVQSEETATK